MKNKLIEIMDRDMREYCKLDEADCLRILINNDDYFNRNLKIKDEKMTISSKFREDLLDIMLMVADIYTEEIKKEILNQQGIDFINTLHAEFTGIGNVIDEKLGRIRKVIRKLKSKKGFCFGEIYQLLWFLCKVDEEYKLNISFYEEIRDLKLDEIHIKNKKYSLFFNQTKSMDYCKIQEQYISENGFIVCKSDKIREYFEKSGNNNELLELNKQKAIEWFKEIIDKI